MQALANILYAVAERAPLRLAPLALRCALWAHALHCLREARELRTMAVALARHYGAGDLCAHYCRRAARANARDGRILRAMARYAGA